MLKFFKNQKGFLLPVAVLAIALSSIIATVVYSLIQNANDKNNLNLNIVDFKSYIRSASETLMLELDLAESKYMESVSVCDGSSDFITALFKGHNCSLIPPVYLFSDDDLKFISKKERSSIKFDTPWKLLQNSVEPSNDKLIAKILIDEYEISFNLLGTIPIKQWLYMSANISLKDKVIYRAKVGFNINTQNYRLHFDTSNFQVIQEIQSPFNPCIAGEWERYKTGEFGKCKGIGEVGGGTGLAMYKNRLFGLRSADGQIIDLLGLDSKTYLVKENGTLGTEKVFLPYETTTLINVDDIEVLGEDVGMSQIYYASGMGEHVQIGYADSNGNKRHPLCLLGKLGWAQSITGLSSSSENPPLVPEGTHFPDVVIANFYVKTDAGELLYVKIRSQKSSEIFNSDLNPNAIVKRSDWKRNFICTVQKSSYVQPIEFLRSMGMTRGINKQRRFFIY